MTFPNTRAVLFDLDGTLLDTAPDMAAALNVLRQEHALDPIPFEQIRQRVSLGASALIQLAFPLANEAEFAQKRARFLEIYGDSLAVTTQPYEGLADVLARLESVRIPWGVVTDKPARFTEPLLEALALRHRAAVVVSGDTLAHRKPHPAPLLHAAMQLGIDPAECVYIGDAERDVLAARAAGMKVYVATFGYIPVHARPNEWPANGWLGTPQALVSLVDSIIAGATG